MSRTPTPASPVTFLISRRIATESYGDFLRWAREGTLLAAGFPGYLGSGLLQPGQPDEEFQIVLRFIDEDSFQRYERSIARRMWLERGAALVKASRSHRAEGIDSWFTAGNVAPPRWKQMISIWMAYFPVLLLFSLFLNEPLAQLPVFWRVLLTTVTLTPLLCFVCMPAMGKLLARWLRPAPAPEIRWR